MLGLGLAALVAAGVLVARVAGSSDAEPRNATDVGFLQDMIDHHDQANLMAAIALRGDASPVIRNAAVDVIASQRYEIGLMEGWLIDWGLTRGAPKRAAMGWMGMDAEPASMPGMATTSQIDTLAKLQGPALDEAFLELMIVHHLGGIHMSEGALKSARNPHVRWMASRIVRNQRREIRDLETTLDLLTR
jgi:uncharacterized protein (DUF305 family)